MRGVVSEVPHSVVGMSSTYDDPVADLDAAATIAALAHAQAARQAAEIEVASLAAHLADLHPVVAGVEPAGWGDCRLAEDRDPLGGEGTPGVAEFCVEELALALGVSPDSARSLLADVLDLRHRLPKTWRLVLAGKTPVWKARLAAEATHHYALSIVGHIDRQLARQVAHRTPATWERMARDLAYRLDPTLAVADEQAARDKRGVWLHHDRHASVARVEILAEVPDAVAFTDTIGQVATQLGRLGDQRPLDARRAAAVGVLASPQTTLDLMSTHPDQGLDELDQRQALASARAGNTRGLAGHAVTGRGGVGRTPTSTSTPPTY